MNVLVTGANGQLGNEIRIVSMNSKDKYVFTDIIDASNDSITMLRKLAGEGIKTDTLHLDITRLDDIREIVKKEKINTIINCAAYTNVDSAEDNYNLAELLNAKAPKNLALAMREVNGLLVHISTDYVFGGDPYNTPCNESQTGTPTGVYGLTKLHGEQAIQEVGCNFIIIRTAWLYSEFGKNFVKTMMSLTNTEPRVRVVFDQTGTPTYAKDLSEVIICILNSWRGDSIKSVFHYSNEGVCSWFDFTKMIAEFSGNNRCDILPCHSSEFPSKVRRPSYSVLDKTLIKNTFNITIPYWLSSLRKCIDNLSLIIE